MGQIRAAKRRQRLRSTKRPWSAHATDTYPPTRPRRRRASAGQVARDHTSRQRRKSRLQFGPCDPRSARGPQPSSPLPSRSAELARPGTSTASPTATMAHIASTTLWLNTRVTSACASTGSPRLESLRSELRPRATAHVAGPRRDQSCREDRGDHLAPNRVHVADLLHDALRHDATNIGSPLAGSSFRCGRRSRQYRTGMCSSTPACLGKAGIGTSKLAGASDAPPKRRSHVNEALAQKRKRQTTKGGDTKAVEDSWEGAGAKLRLGSGASTQENMVWTRHMEQSEADWGVLEASTNVSTAC